MGLIGKCCSVFVLVIAILIGLISFWTNLPPTYILTAFLLLPQGLITQSISDQAFAAKFSKSPPIWLSIHPNVSFEDFPIGIPQDVAPNVIRAVVIKSNTTQTPYKKVIFYLHGGGFVMFRPEDYLDSLSILAAKSDTLIVAIDYPKFPESTGFEADVMNAYQWMLMNLEELGCDRNAKIILGGDSAGGYLALNLAVEIREMKLKAPKGIFALYPVADTKEKREKRDSFLKHGSPFFHLLSGATMQWFSAAHNVNLFNHKFHDLPPTFVGLALEDVLFDEGMDISKKIQADGVNVQLHMYPAQHGLWNAWGPFFFPNVHAQLVSDIVAFLKST